MAAFPNDTPVPPDDGSLTHPDVLSAKVERIRRHGLDIVTVVEFVAEQHAVDPEMLAVAHFSYLLEGAVVPEA